MKHFLFFFCIFPFISYTQYEPLRLKNCFIVGQLENQDDRFTLEVNLAEIFATNGIKTMASLNVLKRGGELDVVGSDSLMLALRNKGIDTYVLVSVRGYDNNFKLSKKPAPIKAELELGHLFPLYRDDINSITFEFNFYKNGIFVGNDLLKLPRIKDRDDVIKKMRKKLPQKINNNWK
jgi:hypothetical protein